jgi:hypothetical protein
MNQFENRDDLDRLIDLTLEQVSVQAQIKTWFLNSFASLYQMPFWAGHQRQ